MANTIVVCCMIPFQADVLYSPTVPSLQLIEKYEQQTKRISYLNDSVNELLAIKMERDELATENKQLQDANKRYHEHTNELQDRVERLLVHPWLCYIHTH